jgi:hypothetical protein
MSNYDSLPLGQTLLKNMWYTSRRCPKVNILSAKMVGRKGAKRSHAKDHQENVAKKLSSGLI